METIILELLNSLYMFHKFEEDIEYNFGDGYQDTTIEETDNKHKLFYWYHHGHSSVTHSIHDILRHGDEDDSIYDEIEDIIWDFMSSKCSSKETVQRLERYSLN